MDNVKSFNIMGIYNLSLDLDALEQFARDTPLPNLVETFSELRQVCLCFLPRTVIRSLPTPVRVFVIPGGHHVSHRQYR